ncbi:unnamed protein product [Coffea canephora]|uniref:DH200=94 genomic scaffold, scaffold_2476 n=1 Tax=Coffea canephora TaxID=49390 RepID=A0A068VK66_COFCA|nr:unnamed protein product [Coffea canephora]
MNYLEDSFQSIALDLGDCVGTESCVDLRSDIDQEFCMVQKTRGSRRNQRLERTEKEYPPPIPWLARTENLPSHMPWIMKRYYTDDGRLIIKEEKVKRHEYFQANRSNGRLTLHLVPLDDDVLDDDCDEEEFEVACDWDSDGMISGRDDFDESRNKKSESCMDNGGGAIVGGDRGGGGGGRGQCYMYSGLAVAAVRPVHT